MSLAGQFRASLRKRHIRLSVAAIVALALALGLFFNSCGSGSNSSGASGSNSSGGSGGGPSISVQPASQIVSAGQIATFTVTATSSTPIGYQWQRNGVEISGATSASYSTPPTSSSDNDSVFRVVVSNSEGSVTSNPATLTVTSSGGVATPVSVLTYHNDVERTGQNLNETLLTPSNVNSATFGKLGVLAVQGKVDAEPLYVPNLTVAGSTHNVVFVATEHDLIYAFDADTFAQLWQTSLLGAGESPSDDRGCSQITPEIGVTSTPVIDPAAGPHGTIFVAAMSKDSSGNYYQRLHALDITTGAEESGSPITVQASYLNNSGQVVFDAKQYAERSGLLLLNGVVYTAWTSHCDNQPYTGWVIGYNENTLQQSSVIDVTPNGSEGAIWMAGAGLAADTSGNIYFLDGNGTFDTTLNTSGFPVNGDYGNAFIKLSTSGGNLSVADYFAMHNVVTESSLDTDLGSGGALVLPDLKDVGGNTVHLAVGAGKDGNIYVVNRDAMGKFNPNNDSAIYQELPLALSGGAYSMPAYFNGNIYYGGQGDYLKAFPIVNGLLATAAASTSQTTFGYPGATPGISANGSSDGIVWAVENGAPAVLHAYDANNLGTELYNSNEAAGGRDQFSGNKFITPMISNGKVYVGTPTGVAVFGLL